MYEQSEPVKIKESFSKILIVDDHPVVREGLVRLIGQKGKDEFVICGEAENTQEALKAIEELGPDLVIVDISLRGSSGIELIKDIRKRFGKLAVLVLSMHDESLYAERSIKAGADGYIMKNKPSEELLNAIRKVLKGGVYLSEDIASLMMRGKKHDKDGNFIPSVNTLSDRELEVFDLLGQGRTTRKIAEELHISIKTVETHFARIKEKLNLKTANELIQHAVQWLSSREIG